jgi:hypothetical protein
LPAVLDANIANRFCVPSPNLDFRVPHQSASSTTHAAKDNFAMTQSTAQQPSDIVALVNISTQKWPPRNRTYFGSLEIRSPESADAFAITPIRGCNAIMDLGDASPRERSPKTSRAKSTAIQGREASTACSSRRANCPQTASLPMRAESLKRFIAGSLLRPISSGNAPRIRCSLQISSAVPRAPSDSRSRGSTIRSRWTIAQCVRKRSNPA